MISIYIISILVLVGITSFAVWIFWAFCLGDGSSKRADAVEKEVDAWVTVSENEHEFDTASFPQGADCIIISDASEDIYVSASQEYEKKLQDFISFSEAYESDRYLDGQDVYLAVHEGGETAYIHYSLATPHEWIFLFGVILIYLLEILIPTMIVIGRIKKGIGKVLEFTEVLKARDLEVNPVNTGIYELDQINMAADGMRLELVNTMEDKWKKEQLSKSEMAQIAHDLKTPLTVIRGNADILLENTSCDEDKECLEDIIRNSEKIAQSVLEILEK